MTTIPNLNIVVQQGSNALEAQHLRPAQMDATQMAGANQPERELDQRETIQESSNSELINTDHERSGNKQFAQQKKINKKKNRKRQTSGIKGRLLDTLV